MSKLTNLDKRYVLAIRIGTEYCPVDYTTGRVCNQPHLEPTIFTSSSRRDVAMELAEAGLSSGDYKFIETLDQTLTRNGFETKLTIVQEDT